MELSFVEKLVCQTYGRHIGVAVEIADAMLASIYKHLPSDSPARAYLTQARESIHLLHAEIIKADREHHGNYHTRFDQ